MKDQAFADKKSDICVQRGPNLTFSSASNQLKSSSDPMWIFDQQTLCILEVNDAALIQHGYSRREFLALTVLDIRPTEDIQEFLRSAYRSPHATETSALWRHQAKNGEIFSVEITSREFSWKGRRVELVRACPSYPVEGISTKPLWGAV